ncbi:hypothetical protein [Nodularia sphaerocarpa]|uniref:hypothetical protein n=1 Tax=Nodularia sphaerocarpa TaxID=137816 RepID=UPI001EFAD19E|nr:hypothetical protein [Nodularia sphaerocarpa]MDB9373976.1 hypothetical protein [Nodularia sphaerocarpa CS-585]MDB9376373.1 hypothetical protein [Nodularia sphaerocarpa CS-585A2]
MNNPPQKPIPPPPPPFNPKVNKVDHVPKSADSLTNKTPVERVYATTKEFATPDKPATSQPLSLREKLGQINKDVWLFLFIVLPFFSLIIYGGFAESNRNEGEGCYDKVAKDLSIRDSGKSVSKDDLRRYYAEMLTKCN